MSAAEIQLHNGLYYNFDDPDPAVLDIDTVAHALSHLCRFSGHVIRFYSVAEHSVRASYIDPTLETLLHDAAESVVIDMPSPLKRMPGMVAYRAFDLMAEQAIAQRFKLTHPWPEATHRADLIMLATERRDLMGPAAASAAWAVLDGVEPVKGVNLASHSGRSEDWKRRFLERFEELSQ